MNRRDALALTGAAALAAAFGRAVPPAAAQNAKPAEDVDVEADQMEILDKEGRAIFTGKVNLTRGDVNLRCDRLVVTYGKTKRTDGTEKTDVTHLDASGSVIIKTKTQTITGQWAKMDVKANKVNVGGNVKVVQGKTAMQGENLAVDLDTDKSVMSGGRVRGSFVPN